MKDSEKSPEPPILLTSKAVAAMLSIGQRTLWRWCSEGAFPAPTFRHNERVVRWHRQVVVDWIEAKRGIQ